jgi:tRNA(Arg) A34 adenosine deaminase TadA
MNEDQSLLNSNYMKLALETAEEAGRGGEVPVGAVIVDSRSGNIVGVSGNRVEVDRDPTAHAEMVVIRKVAALKKDVRLTMCDLYVTLEPCPMCATAISFARIRRVYFGAVDEKGGGIDNGPRIFHQSTCHHRPDVYGGIGATEAAALLREFFSARR